MDSAWNYRWMGWALTEYCLPQADSTLSPAPESAFAAGDNVGSGQELGRESGTIPDARSANCPNGDEQEFERQRAFEIVAEAKNQLTGWQPDSASNNTARKYTAATLRMLRENTTPINAAANRKNYGYLRSAVCWGSRSLIFETLDALNHMEGVGDDDGWWDALFLLEQFNNLAMAAPIKRNVRPTKGTGEWLKSGKKDERLLHTKKRTSIKFLNREELNRWWQLARHSEFPEACAVMLLAGVRGEEFGERYGVTVARDPEGIRITIRGAKRGLRGQHGQESRSLVFPIDTPEAEFLYNRTPSGEFRVDAPRSHILTKTLGRWSQKLWPEQKPLVTPYSFRHLAGARFKKFMSDEEVGLAMRHCTDQTQQYYGLARQWREGRSGVPVAVTATTPIKAKAAAKRAKISLSPEMADREP